MSDILTKIQEELENSYARHRHLEEEILIAKARISVISEQQSILRGLERLAKKEGGQ